MATVNLQPCGRGKEGSRSTCGQLIDQEVMNSGITLAYLAVEGKNHGSRHRIWSRCRNGMLKFLGRRDIKEFYLINAQLWLEKK